MIFSTQLGFLLISFFFLLMETIEFDGYNCTILTHLQSFLQGFPGIRRIGCSCYFLIFC